MDASRRCVRTRSPSRHAHDCLACCSSVCSILGTSISNVRPATLQVQVLLMALIKASQSLFGQRNHRSYRLLYLQGANAPILQWEFLLIPTYWRPILSTHAIDDNGSYPWNHNSTEDLSRVMKILITRSESYSNANLHGQVRFHAEQTVKLEPQAGNELQTRVSFYYLKKLALRLLLRKYLWGKPSIWSI